MSQRRRKFSFGSKSKKEKAAATTESDPNTELACLRAKFIDVEKENKTLRKEVQALTEENKKLKTRIKQDGIDLVDVRSSLQSAIAVIDKKLIIRKDVAVTRHQQRSAAVLDPTPNQLIHTFSVQRRKDIVSITSTTSHESNGSQTPDDATGDKYFTAVISCRSSAYYGSSESEDTSATAAKLKERSQVRANPAAITGPLLVGEVNPLEEEGEEEKEEEEKEDNHVQSTPNPVNPAAMCVNAEGTSCISSVVPKRPLECERTTMKKKSTKPVPSWFDSTESEGDRSARKKPEGIDQHLPFIPRENKGAVSIKGQSTGQEQKSGTDE